MKKKIVIVAMVILLLIISTVLIGCGSPRIAHRYEYNTLFDLVYYCLEYSDIKALWFESNNYKYTTIRCGEIITKDSRKIYLYGIEANTKTSFLYYYPLNAYLFSDHELNEEELEEFKVSNNWYNFPDKDVNKVMQDAMYYVKDKNIDDPTPLIQLEMMRMGYRIGDNIILFKGQKGLLSGEHEIYVYCYPNKAMYIITTEYMGESLRYLIVVEYLGGGKIKIAEDDVFLINDCDLAELSDFINKKAIAPWKDYDFDVGSEKIKYLELD